MLVYDGSIEFECFHENVQKGDQIEFTYEVIEGSALEINILITNPKNETIREDFVKKNGRLKVTTMMAGDYHFCFTSNRYHATTDPKLIMFDLDVYEAARIARDMMATKGKEATKEELGAAALYEDKSFQELSEIEQTARMVDYLLLSTTSCRHDSRYLVARDRIHRRLNEASNKAIVWWSGAEMILVILVTLSQVWYLKRFFEVRMKV